MRFRHDIVLAAALAALGTSRVQAAPDSCSGAAVMPAPSTASASALLAWKPRGWVASGAASLTVAGLRVAIDPVDGTLGMPTAGALSPQPGITDESSVKLTLRPNGSGRAQLDDRFADFAVVSLDACGLPVWTCVHGSHGAARFMKRALVPCPGPSMPEAAPRVEK